MDAMSVCRKSSLAQSSSSSIAGSLSQCSVLQHMQGSHDWELCTCRNEPALGVAVWVRAILPQVLGQPLVQSSSDASQPPPGEPLWGRVSSKSHPCRLSFDSHVPSDVSIIAHQRCPHRHVLCEGRRGRAGTGVDTWYFRCQDIVVTVIMRLAVPRLPAMHGRAEPCAPVVQCRR